MVNRYDDGSTFYNIGFNKLNNSMRLWQNIYKDLENGKYLLAMIVSIRKDNSIDFNNELFKDISQRSLQNVRMKFRERGIIKWIKLYDDDKHKWYLNPIVETYGRQVRVELIREFSEENEKLGYKRNNRLKNYINI